MVRSRVSASESIALPDPHPLRFVGLRDQIQRTLIVGYIVEGELGGGGMSRRSVATESALFS